MTGRRLLRTHGEDLLAALHEQARESAFEMISARLKVFLETRVLTDEDRCAAFVDQLPNVLSRCDDPDTYLKPMAAPAYAYLHFLDRYRRFWSVLETLVSINALPLSRDGIAMLDIGTGPAPIIYATQDFYQGVRRFGLENEVLEFAKQDLSADSLEMSREMRDFFHSFSESMCRPGPFGSRFLDLSQLDLKEEYLREIAGWAWARTYGDEDEDLNHIFEEQLREIQQSRAARDVFKYNLVVASYVFTGADIVRQFEGQLLNSLSFLRPGATVVFVGGTGRRAGAGSYEESYLALDSIMDRARFVRLPIPLQLPIRYDNQEADEIKAFYGSIWAHLYAHLNVDVIARAQRRLSCAADVWDPEIRLTGPKVFGVRAYRLPGSDRKQSSDEAPPLTV